MTTGNNIEEGFEIIESRELPIRTLTPTTPTDETSDASPEASITFHQVPQKNSMVVSVHPPDEPTDKTLRNPCDIVLVIDVSGSMGDDASLPTEDNSEWERNGLTVLDLTVHAAKAIIEPLAEDDRLGIVAFSSEPRIVFKLQCMTEFNKKQALEELDLLSPIGMTNLWQGISRGLKVLEQAETVPENIQALFVLTDGVPNLMCPGQGYVPKLSQVLGKHFSITGNRPIINTFGFGGDLRSSLLQSIAEVGSGIFGFIPDAGMIGTVFIHAMANLFSTFAVQMKIDLESTEPISLRIDNGCQTGMGNREKISETSLVLGKLQYGQSRDIVIHYDDLPPNSQVEIKAQLTYTVNNEEKSVSGKGFAGSQEITLSQDMCDYHIYRAKICDFLRAWHPFKPHAENFDLKQEDIPRDYLERLITELKERKHSNEYNNSLFEDLAGQDPHGQISLAMSRPLYYRTWGRHYLLSVLNAHVQQICISFKDPGPLMYGKDSPFFNYYRDLMDGAFDNLPPPVSSNPQSSKVVVNMKLYNNASGVCFTGKSSIQMANGSSISMQNLRPGASVWTPSGPRNVRAVVQTQVKNMPICKIGEESLEITPWHPIRTENGHWEFPCRMDFEPMLLQSGSVYSVLLAPDSNLGSHAIMVGGRVCVTLGHGIESGNDVRAHELFGNYQRISCEVEKLPKFPNGVSHCLGIDRCSASGRISGFVRPKGHNDDALSMTINTCNGRSNFVAV
ncbi:hypothetical protein FQN57_003417 [Myotisia sp. PD_48]|nr:hypothetical protein FQN57_003417 [Myotisia sp. PD_48]